MDDQHQKASSQILERCFFV